jgi:sulfonate transport system ATP-binding protein
VAAGAAVTLVRVRGLSKTYWDREGRPHPALRGVSLAVASGEFAVVLGPSGCGKTTLLRLVGGLDRDYTGTIDLQPCRIGFVFQEPRLLPWLTVCENIRFVLPPELRRDGDEMIRTWLNRVGLGRYGARYPHELSLGMQQRVALARAFAVRPDLLLLDEPTSALDEITAQRVLDHLVTLLVEERPTVIMVTHRVEEAVLVGDRAWVLTPGPGRVWTEVTIDLPRPRRRDAAFWQVVEQIRAAAREAANSVEERV